MSPRSSLLKRAIAPLLAVAAATTLCDPTRAATASWKTCGVENQGSPYAGIHEVVDCNFTGNAIWKTADFHCLLLGGDGTYNPPQPADVNEYCGVGDYFYSSYFNLAEFSAPHGTYNCWCVCSGTDYYGAAWDASTGGTTYVSY